ncbi:hypothetical protein [Streptomyces sp. CBMA156]|uniref:hypothetical protein n=1 Tax=Streptomyces sp. CBMA156 TaxID=1930280 RepID=UPI001661C13D|nr:hypothetical protein [Streptomyces sp. CBMA156]MBD0673601.1 hypothetical protein [Streptomyces sp. CBMA156]
MNSDHRRPMWQPFSEPATDIPVQPSGGARLLAVERAPFLEPPAAEAPAVPAARRRLGPGGLAAPAVPDDRN